MKAPCTSEAPERPLNLGNSVDKLTGKIDPERIKNLTLDLVRIPSPSGQERCAAEFYADYLRRIGLEVELDDEYADSPSVVARVKGTGGGPTLQLDGHTDTIASEGPTPHYEYGYIYGRGAEDMKGPLAAMAEAARVLVESGIRLHGDLLLIAHGRHESATNEPLEALICKGVHGDAVIIAELGGNSLPIAGMGLAFFEVRISREGEVVHETAAPPDMPHPILAGVHTVALLQEQGRALSKHVVPDLGPESLFIGRFQSGDYYNRLPIACQIAGTRRFGPERCLADVRQEFGDLGRQISEEMNVQVDIWLNGLEGFRVAADERIVTVIRRAYRQVTGQDLPLVGTRTAANAPHFVHLAGVPAVYYGVRHLTGHSDDERVELAELVRAVKVYIHAIVDYVGIAGVSS